MADSAQFWMKTHSVPPDAQTTKTPLARDGAIILRPDRGPGPRVLETWSVADVPDLPQAYE